MLVNQGFKSINVQLRAPTRTQHQFLPLQFQNLYRFSTDNLRFQLFGSVSSSRSICSLFHSPPTRLKAYSSNIPHTFHFDNMPSEHSIKNLDLFDLADRDYARSFVNGKWISSKTGNTFEVTNPGTCGTVGSLTDMSVDETKEAISLAHEAFLSFRKSSPKDRGAMLRRWYDLMIENAEDLAQMLTLENGKALCDARGEITYAASFLDWFSGEAVRIYGDSAVASNPSNRVFTVKQPVGVVGIITPWNFPAAMITRKIGAAVAAGCTVVIKPASETPFTCVALAKLAEKAGVPAGVINVITARTSRTHGLELTTNPLVRKVSFTGSTGVGKALMQQSSSTLKKLSLELGGNAPFIVFDDADLEKAADALVACKFRGSGQTCVCANRVYVQAAVYDAFATLLTERVSKFKLGYGLDAGVTHGPLVNGKSVAKVKEHVENAVSNGARVLIGGRVAEELGPNYFEPTVLAGVTQDMQIAHDETFGPVAGLIQFDTQEQVMEWANNADVGLAGYVFSSNVSRIFQVAETLEVGMIGCNTGMISDVVSPFGGVKESGFGREGSKYGVEEYMNIKSITLSLA
ncbi:succinate-semialdehyde dehydrogenase [Schizosaccharomyces japonicus yFS275]|uniref:Succinate-semialdehyde dehydrogenase n=1 Tax=Schizosaccharomyces japonicus (strain yFS275 / FY16936) TaxID=402676 RepID=B6K3V2_SCHJY|nr:succinate-semialdehyde dehydrogenase [Schizosaccharomyces japonicus yFS275]EEB08159.2 succinate-semialdehyde dehydrogenase [Schizosaccharomyces japonicus yFS275]